MYKLDVGLGFSVIRDAFESFNKGLLDDAIGQHRVILSDNIMNYYLSQSGHTGIWGAAIMSYISSIANTRTKSVHYSSEEKYSDVKEEIISYVKKAPMRILISDETEFTGYKLTGIHLTSRENIESKDFKFMFNRYVFPISQVAQPGDDSTTYIKWLEHLFENESTIYIVDPYLMGEINLRLFIETILPTLPPASEIKIYSALEKSRTRNNEEDYSQKAEEVIANINETQNRNISINWCSYSNMHDRYIILSDCEIEITGGLSVLNNTNPIKKECRFSASREKKRSLPTTIEQALFSN